MATEEEVRRAQARMAQGQRSIRQSAEGTNDWLDDITDTLAAATKLLNETMTARPDTKAAYIPVLEQLVQLSFRMITMRYDVTSGQPPHGPVDNANGRGEDDDMDARITALEKDISAIKTDVAVIRSNYASKEDLHRELHGATWKVIGSIALMCAAVFFISKNTGPTPVTAPAVPAAPAAAAPPASQAEPAPRA